MTDDSELSHLLVTVLELPAKASNCNTVNSCHIAKTYFFNKNYEFTNHVIDT